ncbi:MAG: hypothetical protein ABIJ36_00225 [Patescibacteria group bacterium]
MRKQNVWILILVCVFVLGLFGLWQFSLYQKLSKTGASCGGDWSYNVQCPFGSYCRSLKQGPLVGGSCKPFFSSILDIFIKTKSENVSKDISEPIFEYMPNVDMKGAKAYQTSNFTFKYPLGWKVSTKQIGSYNSPTLELTKGSGEKIQGGYELPQIWIGSFEIYSTSGAICANESYCEKVDKISFSIKGKNYSTDVFKRQLWEQGKFTGKYFYVFQIGSNSELGLLPSKPTITGQFETTAEKSEIESILSSINY